MPSSAQRLKIGFVLDDSLDTTDGVQQYVLTLGEWLSGQGQDVHYLVGQTARSDIAQVHSLSRNLRVRFNGNRMSMPLPARVATLRALLRQENFDVLHVQLPYSPWLAHRILKLAPKRTAVIGTFHIVPHSNFSTLANRFLARWLHQTLRRFDKAFAVSTAAQDFAREVYHMPTTVLPNVVDIHRFAAAKSLKKYQDEVFTIMFLGRLVPRKGCITLLRAVSSLQKRTGLIPFRVVVCGKGPLEAELISFVATHQLKKVVEFAGFLKETDKPAYLKSADALVFPSSGGESFGIVLLEGMAGAHALVLGGDNEGYRTVLAPRPDLLFPATDAQVLADKLSFYMQNFAERRKLVQWQTEYVQQFDAANVGKKLLKAYIDCCTKNTNHA